MDSSTNEPIHLSDNETEILKRALVEAQRQAEFPTAGETETQFIRRTDGDTTRKSGNTQQVTPGPEKMIL